MTGSATDTHNDLKTYQKMLLACTEVFEVRVKCQSNGSLKIHRVSEMNGTRLSKCV